MTKSFRPSERSRILHEVSDMYLKGLKQWEISKELKISPASVSRAVILLQHEWRTERIENINELKVRELERVDVLERSYWEAWVSSKKDKVRKNTRSISGPLGTTEEEGETKECQYGDPRFLQGIQWCIDKRCEILGIDNASKNESTSVLVKSIVIQLPGGMQNSISGNVPLSLPITDYEEGQVLEIDKEEVSKDGRSIT